MIEIEPLKEVAHDCNEFSFLDMRHGIVTPLEFIAVQAIATFQLRNG